MGGVVLFTCVLLINALSVRLYINAVIEYKLNKNALKSRKLNKTFLKWLSYSQYREVVPPIMLFWYFAEIVFSIVASLSSLFLYLLNTIDTVINMFYVICIIIAIAPRLFLSVFWGWYYGIPNKEQASKLIDLNKRYYKKKKKHPLQKKK